MTNLLLRKNIYAGLTYDNFDGSDCSGTDKAVNRTLDVSDGVGFVVLERKILHPVSDYTVSGTTITFLIAIDNRYRITVFR